MERMQEEAGELQAEGLIQTSRLAAASQAIQPGQVTLEVIAAAVIGGTSLFGGRGSVWSALLGAVVIGSVANDLDRRVHTRRRPRTNRRGGQSCPRSSQGSM